jgi:hypothetical protein
MPRTFTVASAPVPTFTTAAGFAGLWDLAGVAEITTPGYARQGVTWGTTGDMSGGLMEIAGADLVTVPVFGPVTATGPTMGRVRFYGAVSGGTPLTAPDGSTVEAIFSENNTFTAGRTVEMFGFTVLADVTAADSAGVTHTARFAAVHGRLSVAAVTSISNGQSAVHSCEPGRVGHPGRVRRRRHLDQ